MTARRAPPVQMQPAHRARLQRVMDTIARAVLGDPAPWRIGDVTLRPHQVEAAARLREIIAQHGGAMLADSVGLGKTYTALAACLDAANLLVVAPAALRAMWQDALRHAHRTARIVSFEALSRGAPAGPAPDFVLVDEAHHVRNPNTRRYPALARFCTGVPVLLLSATPVHNSVQELRHQLGLFLGARAHTLSEIELAACIVRRDPASLPELRPALPAVGAVRWLECGDDSALLDQLQELPPPVPPADGGHADALVALSLIRQWASSRAALRTALRRRLSVADALLAALEAGRYPTRAELRAWTMGDGALQLAFPELVAATPAPAGSALADSVRAHRSAICAMLVAADAAPDPDARRADALRAILEQHAGAVIIVFSEFAATVTALHRRLAHLPGIAMLTERGGLVASGRVPRRDILRQLAPGPAPPDHQRIALLVTTDVLSEGVNLQRASVVVHADLPWSPARVEQRIGRVRRLGSTHREIAVYALRPPAATERILNAEDRLRAKISAAARSVGVAGLVMPRMLGIIEPEASAVAQHAELVAELERWRAAPSAADSDSPVVAAVRATRAGFIAVAVPPGQRPAVVVSAGAAATTALPQVLDAVRACTHVAAPVDEACERAARCAVLEWCARRATVAPLDAPSAAVARVRRRLLRRIDAIASRAPRHLRPELATIAREARRAATVVVGAGGERVLQELADSPMADLPWLTAVRTFASMHGRQSAVTADPAITALLLLVPR